MKALAAAFLFLAGCTHSSGSMWPDSVPPPLGEMMMVDALCELGRSELSEGLSGTWYEPVSRTLYAVQDTNARIVPFTIPNHGSARWTPGTPIALQGRPSATWDGEALSHAHGEFLVVADEGAGQIERFDHAGHYLGALPLPERFARPVRENKGIEGLSVSPDERFLFAANEAALEDEGPLATHALGTTVRILRRELASGRDEQRAYRTEPLGAGGDGEMGVSDIAALDDDVLLVLERGYQAGYGNTVRIFFVDFRQIDRASGLDRETPLLRKTLWVDFARLPARGAGHDSPQPNPILENYEALALGPTATEHLRELFVTSDDNASTHQRARILTLVGVLPP
jgi:hypothetical protein